MCFALQRYIYAGGADYIIRVYALDQTEYSGVEAYYRQQGLHPPGEMYTVRTKFAWRCTIGYLFCCLQLAEYVGHAGRVETVALHPQGQVGT